MDILPDIGVVLKFWHEVKHGAILEICQYIHPKGICFAAPAVNPPQVDRTP
jgi:hypothetical protein